MNPVSDPKDIYRHYCTCGHLELSHDLNTKGVRTSCFHIDGPKGVRCGCPKFMWDSIEVTLSWTTPPTTGT